MDDLSVRTYLHTCVHAYVGLSSALWKNGGSDPDAVCHRSDGSRDEAGSAWGLWIGPWEGVFLGANLRHAIVTNGDFTAYVCDSAVTWLSSQIYVGKLVYIVMLCWQYLAV